MFRLSTDPVLKGKDLTSFSIAPIQRLSRYKLLIDAVNKSLQSNEKEIMLAVGTSLSNKIDQVFLFFHSNKIITCFSISF